MGEKINLVNDLGLFENILEGMSPEVKEIAGNIQNERASMQQGQKDDVDKEIEDEDQDDDNTTTTATTTNTVPTQ